MNNKTKKGDISLLATLLACSILLILLAPMAQKVSVESKISRENLMSQQAVQAAKTGLDAWLYEATKPTGTNINTDVTFQRDWPNILTTVSKDDSGTPSDSSDDFIILDSSLGIQYQVKFEPADNIDPANPSPAKIISKGRVKRGAFTIERTLEATF
jgi:hypothetical protein